MILAADAPITFLPHTNFLCALHVLSRRPVQAVPRQEMKIVSIAKFTKSASKTLVGAVLAVIEFDEEIVAEEIADNACLVGFFNPAAQFMVPHSICIAKACFV